MDPRGHLQCYVLEQSTWSKRLSFVVSSKAARLREQLQGPEGSRR